MARMNTEFLATNPRTHDTTPQHHGHTQTPHTVKTMKTHTTDSIRTKAMAWGTSAALLMVLTLTSVHAHAALTVVTTTTDLAALTQAIGGERVKVMALARPNEDPHYVDPKPSHVLKLNKADMLVFNGLELEIGWLPKLVVQARNTKVAQGARGYVNASSVVRVIRTQQGADRSQGDVHPGGNPHFLLDPNQGLRVAALIASRLSALDPKGKAFYDARLKGLKVTLKGIALRHSKKFKALPERARRVVTYHDSTVYLSKWLGLKEILQVEPKPGISPSPKHIVLVLKTMRAQGSRVIIQEAYYPRKVSTKLTTLAKGKLVVIAGGAKVKTNQTYAQRVDLMATAIYSALSTTGHKR